MSNDLAKRIDKEWLKRKSKYNSKFYDKAGVPLSLGQWCQLFEDFDYRRIAHDQIGGVNVSTVWLGIDHNWSGKGAPVIFETMVFGLADLGLADREQWRWSTLEEAREGHRHIVGAVRQQVDQLISSSPESEVHPKDPEQA